MTSREHEPFMRLALAEAEEVAVPMPSVSVVRDRLITGLARGYADLDWTALGLIAAEEAGLHANVPATCNERPAPGLAKKVGAGTET